MTAIPVTSSTSRKRNEPPLMSGDRLSRDEFERRYEASPPGFRAELIEGVVYVASPVSERFHGQPHLRVITWLGTYLASTPHLLAGDNSTVRLDLDNEPQPDVYLRVEPEAGGMTSTDPETGYVIGAPELVVEVAASSRSIDLNSKLNAYRRNGVKEYIVVQTYEEVIDWFVLRGSSYERLTAADGILRSELFPGLWLDSRAMLTGDLAGVLRVLQQGLGTPEHGQFVDRLNNTAGNSRTQG
jgi:Uma2 family endonuclease